MIIVKLIGGLGNQLFQYAAGRRVALERNTPLVLDASPFERYYKLYGYALSPFNIAARVATAEETAEVTGWGRALPVRLALRAADRLRPYYARRVVYERALFRYDPNILRCRSDAYLDGYWQSYRYFDAIAPAIRQELTLREPSDDENRRLADAIRNCPSVAVHVRRGDYVSDPETRRIHGGCGLDYYAEAVRRIAERVEGVRVFAFSDDPDWVRENLALKCEMHCVAHNGAERNYEDLRLMALCRHHVIANSSFSWWGAWLAAHPQQIVFAPRVWMREGNPDTRDLIPEHWQRL